MIHSYRVENGLLKPDLFANEKRRIALFCEERFLDHPFCTSLKSSIFPLAGGEQCKSRHLKELLEDQLIDQGFGRDSLFLAMGGGAVTDLVGFLASTYCRGVGLQLIPTTLLGMVDAAIGGKNGLNAKGLKNFIGTTYLPETVLVDPLLLQTLPESEFNCGMMEAVKHGIIADPELFTAIESNVYELASFIKRNIEIKLSIVSKDLKEGGLRRLLNTGHTVAHGIEALFQGEISHGHAVAMGLNSEAKLSHRLGYLDAHSQNRIEQLLSRYFPLSVEMDIDQLIKAMSQDKKALSGTARFVLYEAIGKPLAFEGNYCSPCDENLLKEVLCSSLIT